MLLNERRRSAVLAWILAVGTLTPLRFKRSMRRYPALVRGSLRRR